MITKELAEQWVQDVHAHMHLGMAPVFHTHKQVKDLCELAAAHGAAQRDAELLEPIGRESLLGAIARGWCHEANANKTMDVDLAIAIAKEVDALYATQLAAARLQEREHWRKFILNTFGLETE